MSYMKNIGTITLRIFKPSTGGFNWWTGCHMLTSFSQTVSWFTTDSFWNSFTQQCWKERSAVKKNIWTLCIKQLFNSHKNKASSFVVQTQYTEHQYSVIYSDYVGAGWSSVGIWTGARDLVFLKLSRQALCPTQSPINAYWHYFLGVKWPGPEVDHSPPCSAKVSNELRYTSAPLYAFKVWTGT